jgi:putative Ca2+/H+ antiporter (TMEM165/GDT1 family)
MNIKIFAAVFLSIFLAELGDKTQMATLLLASDSEVNKFGLFAAAASALVLATFMAVVVGSFVSRLISPQVIKLIAGIGFVAIGIWILWGAKA